MKQLIGPIGAVVLHFQVQVLYYQCLLSFAEADSCSRLLLRVTLSTVLHLQQARNIFTNVPEPLGSIKHSLHLARWDNAH